MSAMWIKICGMTTPEAIEAALAANVDAVGFVFAKSSRQVSPERAALLARPARGRVQCIAVTRHPTQREVDEIITGFAPDGLQTDQGDLGALRLPQELGVLPVWRAGEAAPAHWPPRLLFEGPVSGTGVPCDWSRAKDVARHTQLVLAGGLNADNVAAAVCEVRPYGVDVSSGVEERPGIKSPAKIARFAGAVRRAFAGLEEIAS